MKERPISFSGAMVIALLEGRKTQTRRIVKLGKLTKLTRFVRYNEYRYAWCDRVGEGIAQDERYFLERCIYGQVGDRLWVKEAWRTLAVHDHVPGGELSDLPLCYPADYEQEINLWGRYRHARFMPRWASRITLEITGVGVERLQDISEEDAKAEGAMPWTGALQSYRTDYCHRIWESINGKGSWMDNPFVWVISFKQI